MTRRMIQAIVVAAVFSLPLCVAAAQEQAAPPAALLEKAGIQGGLVIHLGCGDGRRTAELAPTDAFRAQGWTTDAKATGAHSLAGPLRLQAASLPAIRHSLGHAAADPAASVPAGVSALGARQL